MIYVITKDGPEWSKLIAAYEDKNMADKEAQRLNEGPKRNVFDDLSTYVVTPLKLNKKSGEKK